MKHNNQVSITKRLNQPVWTSSACAPLQASAVVLLCCLSGAAYAQTASAPAVQKAEEVVVTGTSIRGVAAVGAPALAMDRAVIAASGVSDTSDMARTLPQVINLGADESRLTGGQDAGSNTTRTSGINLRGIGNEATLVLMNGHRMSASGVIKSLSDVNQIPAAAVQRIEVVLDGASAIYGSDAVAGVVNIITRKNVNAIESTLRYASADGMSQKIFSQTFGKTWDTGSVFMAYEHNDRSRLAGTARPFFSQDLRSYGGTDQRSNQAGPGNIIIGSTIYPIPAGQNGVGLSPAQLVPGTVAAGTVNLYDPTVNSDFLPSQKRDTFFGNIYQQINDRLEVFYEGLYSKRKYNQQTVPFSANLNYLSTYPYYVRPAGAAPGTSETVAYRFVYENSDLNFGGYENNNQNVIGASFDLGNDWALNGYQSFGKTDGFVHRGNGVNSILLTAALANGGINPFSAVAGSNPAFQGITSFRNQSATNDFNVLGAKADGPIMLIGGGAVRVAVGAEESHVGFKQTLVSNNTSPTNVPVTSTLQNNRTIKALYSELSVPLVSASNAMPMVSRLELSLAARYEQYSDFGNTTNPKIGVVWAPNQYVSFSSTYGTSFRAPSLVDNLGSLTSLSLTNVFIGDYTDPTSPTRLRHGILYNGGNANLKPEKAKTWSFGIELKPIKNLHLSASYYNVDYENRIDAVPNTALTNEALYGPYIIRNPSVALVNTFLASPNLASPTENPANILVIIDGRKNNLGTLRQQGVDFNVGYSFSSAVGDWMLGLDAAKILKLMRSSAPGQPFIDVLDTLNNPVSLRSRANVGWKKGNWSANAFVNYTTDFINTAVTPNVSVSSYTTVDASLAYDFGANAAPNSALGGVKVSLSAQNLFDRDPPVVINGTSSWDSQTASAIGRFVALEISKSW